MNHSEWQEIRNRIRRVLNGSGVQDSVMISDKDWRMTTEAVEDLLEMRRLIRKGD